MTHSSWYRKLVIHSIILKPIFICDYSMESSIALNLKFIFYHDIPSHIFNVPSSLSFSMTCSLLPTDIQNQMENIFAFLYFDFVLISETIYMLLHTIIYFTWNTLSALYWHCSFCFCRSLTRVSTERFSLMFVLNWGFPVICYHRTFFLYFIIFTVTLYLNNLIKCC